MVPQVFPGSSPNNCILSFCLVPRKTSCLHGLSCLGRETDSTQADSNNCDLGQEESQQGARYSVTRGSLFRV